jgi:predicted helicase
MVPALIGEHLLPHLYGFELLPAPYAIAHLKLGSFYAQAGRPLEPGERVGIYLTNTLAAPIDPAAPALPTIGALIAEARSADEVKRETPILVIMGNPPYSESSHNKEHLGALMEAFGFVDGEPLRERNVRPLDDDYLRFFRWSVWKLLEQPHAPRQGVVALVTNRAWLSRPVMRGVRRFALRHFDEIRVLDLHGNQRQWYRDQPDEKVFPKVQVGIAITLFVRYPVRTHDPARVYYRGTQGRVEDKFAYLDGAGLADPEWTEVTPRATNYTLLPREAGDDYDTWPAISDLMPERSPGVISHRDPLSVAYATDELLVKVREFANLAIPDAEIKERYELGENDRWLLHRRRAALGGIVDPALVRPLHFRPHAYPVASAGHQM